MIQRHKSIEKENHRLLQRFIEIENKSKRQVNESKRVVVDNKDGTAHKMAPTRKRELERIERENAGLLRRITEQKGTLNMRKIDAAAHDQQKIMRMRCAVARFDDAGIMGRLCMYVRRICQEVF